VNWIALRISWWVWFGFIYLAGLCRSPLAQGTWINGRMGWRGRVFGTSSLFLVGGDVYTAYTLSRFRSRLRAGAVGILRSAYTIIIYPLLFLVYRRLWNCATSGYITAGDFSYAAGSDIAGLALGRLTIRESWRPCRTRHGSRRHQVVIGALGISGARDGTLDLPFAVALSCWPAFTYFERSSRPASDRDRQGHLDLCSGGIGPR